MSVATPKNLEVTVCQVDDLKDGEKKEFTVGENKKVLVSRIKSQFYATSHLCPHYKAPMVKGVLTSDGRLMCPWHGACFNVKTGDIEDAPSVDSLVHFPTRVKDGQVFVSFDPKSDYKRIPKCVRKVNGNQESVVIIGSGAAGVIAAESLRQEGYTGSITIVSKESYIPIDRPKLSKSLGVDATKIALRSEEQWKEMDIEFKLSSEVTGIDFNSKTVTVATPSRNENLMYKHLILATGGTPRRLTVPGSDLDNILVLRTVDDSASLAKAYEAAGSEKPNVVVIGAGFIGMEAAAMLAKSANVTVLGNGTVPLERALGTKVGAVFQKLHESNGVTFKLNNAIAEFLPSETDPKKVGYVKLSSGDQLAADVVILGAGVTLNTQFLSANNGIKLDKDGGITVDDCMKVPGLNDVYAVGDIARFPNHLTGEHVRIEHWNVAMNQGRTAAKNIVHPDSPASFKTIPYFWTTQYGKSLRYCGHAPRYEDVIIEGNLDEMSFVAYYHINDTVVAVASLAKDPAVSHCSELLRFNKMPSASEIKNGLNPLDIGLKGS
ncbi:aif-like mitochondrial oxidoreductase [Paraphysoderma sedebokerense]|nr:aif-like mitochondrial oxidoreductase [Paraphysoderma sedebokerense]